MGEKHQPSALAHAVSMSLATAFACAPAPALAQDGDTPETMDVIEVIGVTPTLGVGLPENRIPYNVQSATSEDLQKGTSLDITDYMNRNFASVIVNDAQNNPLQPDIQYRGFTASPLLGLPQGLAIYQNGVRINEVFGDTINWDLIPESSIANMNLIGGANPLYGLNTLGGAISLETKTGFSHPGHSVEAYGGSFGRVVTTLESGANNGTLGYYATFQYFDEDGWRDQSPSESKNLFASLNYRDGTTTSLDLNFNYGDTDLIGNGAIPIELAAIDREAIFTAPDQTENEMFFVELQGEHWINDLTQIAGNIFYRDNDTTSFNGDGTEFEECELNTGDEFLAEGDDDDLDAAGCDDGTATIASIEAAGGELIEDQFGNFIPAEDAQGNERNGLNNRSLRDQKNWGGTFQTTYLGDLFGRENQVIVGAAYNFGEVDFNSNQEIARLNARRSTIGTGLFVPEEGTRINSETRSWSIFVTDTLSLTEKLDLTLSGRFNSTNVKLQDRGATDPLADENPELNGDHDFDRFNPAAGITYAFQPNLSGYFNYSESSRAPTAVELACAEPDAPCNLPNGFLADPPLEQVVAKSFEGGFRGRIGQFGMLNNIGWHIGGFHTTNEDDIIFLSTGGVSSNEGFFDNVGDTERVGMELGLTGQLQRLDWFLAYSYVSATFETPFAAASANHPLADDDGEIQVQPGDDIPGIPDHTFKVGGDYAVTSKLSVGADLLYKSGVHLRGDESNLLGKLDGYTTVNIRGNYQVNKHFSIFARVNNLFDEEYNSFGLLGEPDEVPGFENFSDNRFVGPGAPISGFVGVRLQL